LLYEGGNDNDEHGDDTPRNIHSRIDTTYLSDVYNILGSSSVHRSYTTSNRPPGEWYVLLPDSRDRYIFDINNLYSIP
jgi:hypothetical protein